jgi:hypothetical protein
MGSNTGSFWPVPVPQTYLLRFRFSPISAPDSLIYGTVWSCGVCLDAIFFPFYCAFGILKLCKYEVNTFTQPKGSPWKGRDAGEARLPLGRQKKGKKWIDRMGCFVGGIGWRMNEWRNETPKKVSANSTNRAWKGYPRRRSRPKRWRFSRSRHSRFFWGTRPKDEDLQRAGLHSRFTRLERHSRACCFGCECRCLGRKTKRKDMGKLSVYPVLLLLFFASLAWGQTGTFLSLYFFLLSFPIFLELYFRVCVHRFPPLLLLFFFFFFSLLYPEHLCIIHNP